MGSPIFDIFIIYFGNMIHANIQQDSKNRAEKSKSKLDAQSTLLSSEDDAFQESPRFLLSGLETRSSPSSSSASTKSLESPEGGNLNPCAPKLSNIQRLSDGHALTLSEDIGSSMSLDQNPYHPRQVRIGRPRKRAVSWKQQLPGQSYAPPQNRDNKSKENLRPKRKMRRILCEIEGGQFFGAKSCPNKLYNQFSDCEKGNLKSKRIKDSSNRRSLVAAKTPANFDWIETFSQKLEPPQEQQEESYRELKLCHYSTASDLTHENSYQKEYAHIKFGRRSVSSMQAIAEGKTKSNNGLPREIRPAERTPLPSPPLVVLKQSQSDPYSLLKHSKMQKTAMHKERQSIMKRSQSVTLAGMQVDMNSSTTPKLPVVKTDHEGVQAISARTVAQILKGKFSHLFDKVILCDARYPYEYNGGHIRGAVCTTLPSSLDRLLFNNTDIMSDDPCKVCVVAHCEFSANRGPRAVRYIRRKDRDLHGISNFPKLYYPELYLMKGGYLVGITVFRQLYIIFEYLFFAGILLSVSRIV
eukprot:jgi/Bigna1/126036/aug1.1_g744